VTKGLVCLAAVVLLAPGSLRAQSANAARSGPGEGTVAQDRREMEEDVEIMRRLLNRSLSGWFVQAAEANRAPFAFTKDRKYLATREGNSYKVWEVSTGKLLRQTTLPPPHAPIFAPAEGVYLKGRGVVYTITLPPTAHSVKTASAKPSAKPLSDWDRARNEIRGAPAEPDTTSAAPPPSLTDTILRLLAKNGHQFKQLGPNEKLTVVVTFRQPGDGIEQAASTTTVGGPTTGPASAGVGSGVTPAGTVTQASYGSNGSSRPPSSARDFELMGDLHIKQGRAQEAAHAYQKALELKPGGARSAEESRLYRKLAQVYLTVAEQSPPHQRDAIVRRAIDFLQRVAQQTDGAQPAPAALPGRLVISARKGVLDQAGSGKMTPSEFRQASSVEFQPALTAEKAPASGR
jgi:hypothetical protein